MVNWDQFKNALIDSCDEWREYDQALLLVFTKPTAVQCAVQVGEWTDESGVNV